MFYETLVRCAAPTMARLKTGNMFSCAFESREAMVEELRRFNLKLSPKGLRILPLRWREGRALLYLYRPKLLARDLQNPQAQKLLGECAYPCGSANACIAKLIQRLKECDTFPHEVGLFLGYPPADVEGFMRHSEACKLCGLWKVYSDVASAEKQFDRCRRCTEIYMRRFSEGTPLERLAVAY